MDIRTHSIRDANIQKVNEQTLIKVPHLAVKIDNVLLIKRTKQEPTVAEIYVPSRESPDHERYIQHIGQR